MKKLFLSFTLIGFFFINSQTKTYANTQVIETGKWVDYYDGQNLPQGAICASSWWHSECVVGDKRTIVVKN